MKGTKAMSAAERARNRRERLRAAGHKLVHVWLSPETQSDLVEIQEHSGCTQEETINLAIQYSKEDLKHQ